MQNSNFGGMSSRFGSRRRFSLAKVVLGLTGIAAVAVLGTTLAANIALNDGGSVEFGQGVALTSACDTDGITATPKGTFNNAPGAGTFNFNGVAFSEISSNCIERTFTLKAYDDTSATPLELATDSVGIYDQATFVFTTTSTLSPAITASNVDVYAGTFTISFDGTQATTGAIAKMTLESQ